jgi:acyl dehydratase
VARVKFDDFRNGQSLHAGSFTLTEPQLVEFARDWDPQWFHTDAAAAANGPYGGLIASGWQTCGIAMRLAVEHVLADSESFGSPGVAYIKWLEPVRAGDALSLTATVIEARRSSSKPTLGVLRWRWQLFNQHGLEVLDLEATSLFDLAPKAAG